MIAADFDPLFWRGIVIGAIVVVFVLGAITVRALAYLGRGLGRRARPSTGSASGGRDVNRVACSNSPAVRDATAHTAGNDPTRPDRFHKEAA
jgi:hypothetical protein